MDYALLKSELQATEYAGLSDAAAASALNAKTVTTLKPFMFRFRSLYLTFDLATAAIIEQSFRGMAAALSASDDAATKLKGYIFTQVVKWMDMTGDTSGIDLGVQSNRDTIQSLVPSLLTQAQADAMLVQGATLTPWPIANGCGRLLDFADIQIARELA